MSLQCAFSLDLENQFPNAHFGDADFFVVYSCDSEKIEFRNKIPNPFKDKHSEDTHGDQNKADGIIQLLKEEGINVLISRQFGPNIKRINKHFIPVMISAEDPEQVIQILKKHGHWIEEEWEKATSQYKLFKIKAGVLKLRIEE
ncbi:MAG: NifB/NifX family molybdenum-iron cluster-binding protein [Bacteroidales bacterium]|nr:NifB/NifX family molybdenum-iron cluster-binding protein [Bacteroidales bacterium]